MAFLYPYGDSQQLNLSWFLSTFRELYEYVQNLDPGESSMDAILSRFTAPYDGTKSYTAGQYCIYDGKIYKANKNTTGSFNQSDWDAALPVDEIDTLRQDIAGLAGDVEDLGDDAVTEITYSPGTSAQPGSLSRTRAGQSTEVLSVDAEPTENSNNPVKSGSVYDELTELKGAINAKLIKLTGTLPTRANGTLRTWSNVNGITEDTFVVSAKFTIPDSILSNITVTKDTGSVVISGITGITPTDIELIMGNAL